MANPISWHGAFLSGVTHASSQELGDSAFSDVHHHMDCHDRYQIGVLSGYVHGSDNRHWGVLCGVHYNVLRGKVLSDRI